MSYSKWISESQLKNITKHKKIIFWGKSFWIDTTLPLISGNIEFIIDVNKNNHNTIFQGIDIYSEDKIKTINKKEYIIIITTGNFESVENSLDILEI